VKPTLVGSRALAHWLGPSRLTLHEDKDWDFIGDFNPDDGRKVENHSPDLLNNRVMCEIYGLELGFPYLIMNLNGLKVMKRSHLHRPLCWDKHITHYHKYMSDVEFTKGDIITLLERKSLTYEEYGNKHPKLSQSNDDFFDDFVEKEFEHDYIHELYAYEDRPMFERLKQSGQEHNAWCVRDLWEALTPEQKQQCVSEETYVIATERFMIPNKWEFIPKQAYYMALRKVCTTLTSGWFRDYAIDYFPEVFNLYNKDKFNQVKGILT